MSNKKLHLILWFVLAMFVGVIWSFTSAISFKITFAGSLPARAGYMRRNMTPIHFKDNWNDFGWFIYFSNGIGTGGAEADGEYTVEFGGQIYECQQRAKWFYYNAERGERLWVLDDSYSMPGVILSGGLYTRCRREWFRGALSDCKEKKNEDEREDCERKAREDYVDTHGYYWMIWHTYLDESNKFVLSAWTNYLQDGSQRIIWDSFAPTLIRFDNKYPVWFIYDGNGWLWFLGWEIGDDKEMEDVLEAVDDKGGLDKIFGLWDDGIVPIEGFEWIDTSYGWSAKNSLLSVIVDWLVWINRDTRNTGIQWNQSNDKMQYFSSVNINNMQLINYAKQRAEILCRWKWEKFWGSYDSPLKSLYCFDGTTDGSTNAIRAVTWTTIIVKNGNVGVKNMKNFDSDGNYDIFVNNWNLVIEEDDTIELKVFKNNWFISDMTVDQFSGTVFPILNSSDFYTWDEVVAWRFIKWNFIVNGKVVSKSGSGFDHVYVVYWKMTTKDTVDELSKVFKWRCQRWIQGTDGTPCPGEEKNIDNEGHEIKRTNPYENASLVIIDQNYPSPLYQ